MNKDYNPYLSCAGKICKGASLSFRVAAAVITDFVNFGATS